MCVSLCTCTNSQKQDELAWRLMKKKEDTDTNNQEVPNMLTMSGTCSLNKTSHRSTTAVAPGSVSVESKRCLYCSWSVASVASELPSSDTAMLLGMLEKHIKFPLCWWQLSTHRSKQIQRGFKVKGQRVIRCAESRSWNVPKLRVYALKVPEINSYLENSMAFWTGLWLASCWNATQIKNNRTCFYFPATSSNTSQSAFVILQSY